MTLDTVFGIASMTKAVTATAALQLVEAGRLTLDEPVAARVRSWRTSWSSTGSTPRAKRDCVRCGGRSPCGTC